MITLGNITGTVSVAIDGGEQHSIGRFELPVTTTFDRDTNTATIEAVTDGSLRVAMADALKEAADRILEGMPIAQVTEATLDADTAEDGQVLTCATCGAQMGWNGPATLEHGPGGKHILDSRLV